MPDPRFLRIVEQLRATRFAGLEGARVSVSLPVSERLLNELLAGAIPPSLPIRELSIHPAKGNRLSLRAKLVRVDFLPPINVTVAIEQQPVLPDVPLILRLLTFPGLIALVGAAFPIASRLLPGVRLEKDRLSIDVRAVLGHHGYGDLVPLISSLRVSTDEGKLLVDVDVRV